MEEIKGNPRDHLANERTFLSWIRTSLSIMAFGLAIYKFSIFESYSNIVGIALVALGMLTVSLPFIRYKQSEKQLKEGFYKHSSLLIGVLTTFIFLVSVFLIVYLLANT